MNEPAKQEAENLATATEALLAFLHARNDHNWDFLFERPLKELREWGNYVAAVTLLKQISFGGMGGLIDRDYRADQAHFDNLCDVYFKALRVMEQQIRPNQRGHETR
jgi:hypothetical protein